MDTNNPQDLSKLDAGEGNVDNLLTQLSINDQPQTQASVEVLAPSAALHAFMTWSLGIDNPGFSVVYARDMSHAMDLLEDYVEGAQPKHQLFETYLPQELRKTQYDNAKRIHLFDLGVVEREAGAGILVVDRGYDERFDD